MFQSAPYPANEALRRKAVLSSGLLQMEGDPRLTALVTEARKRFAADWAAIVAILDGWQHVVVSTGGHLGAHRRSGCLSSYALLDARTPFVVANPRADARFRDSLFVENRLIAFYAGAAITGGGGLPIGVLCVTSRTPRRSFGFWSRRLLRERAGRAAHVIGRAFP